MNKKLFFSLTLLIVLVSIVLYALALYNKKAINVADAKPDFVATSTSLLSEFMQNDTIASNKYNGAVLLVGGVIKNVERSDSVYTLFLRSELDSLSAIQCSFKGEYISGDFKPNDSVSLKGIYIGYNKDELLGLDVILNQCVNVK